MSTHTALTDRIDAPDEPATTNSTQQPGSLPATTHESAADQPEELIISFTDGSHTRRRYRFVARDDGQWWRLDEEWTGCLWRPVGRELVSNVSCQRTRRTRDA
jgi:hypothetical protein